MSNGGRWIFSTTGVPVTLGMNNSVLPVFPFPQTDSLNIEVFTNPAISFPIPPETGFQSSISDPGGTLDAGFLTGTNITLGTVALGSANVTYGNGSLLMVDSVTGAADQGPSKITLGSGYQTVVGAQGDTLIGGDGIQILNALAGNETVVGSNGPKDSVYGNYGGAIFGGSNDSIVAGSRGNLDFQIVVTGSNTTVVAGTSGTVYMSLAANDTVKSLPGSQTVVIAAGKNDLIDLTGNIPIGTAPRPPSLIQYTSAVIGAQGDTIIAGGGDYLIYGNNWLNIDGSAGGMLITVGAGLAQVSGSTVAGLHNTIKGGAGSLSYNPGASTGSGDLIDLTGMIGTAQINAFAYSPYHGPSAAFPISAPDTILATNNSDSIFGGDHDRIGTGNGPTVSGLHQWVHGDTVYAGSAVGFGSNDTVASTTYDTVRGTATRGTVPGTSSAQVTVGSFRTATDFLFYQNESAATTSAIIATSKATTVVDPTTAIATPSTLITLPDGTVMTLVGIAQAQLTPGLFKL